MIFLGQHAQVKEGDRKICLSKELPHIKFLGEQVRTMKQSIIALQDKLTAESKDGSKTIISKAEIGQWGTLKAY